MRYGCATKLAVGLLLIPASLAGAWTTIGDGIEYQEYTISGPNNLFVARMDRNNPNAVIESTIGQGRVSGGTERVSSQVSRYDDAINYWGQTWGQRNHAIVGINGSYYNTSTGVPTSGMIHSSWYAKRYDNNTFESGFVWQLDREAFIAGCVTHLAAKQLVTYLGSGNTQQFDGINIARGSDSFIIYTPQFDSDTQTSNSGVEVVVELARPMLLMPTPNMTTGTVRQIRQNQGATPIPFDCVVLSATGSEATTLLSNVSVGAQVGISQEIRSFVMESCAIVGPYDWTKSYAALSGNWVFLRDGVIKYGIDSSGLRHPRTAIALNASYIYFIVCDGRSAISIGMTINELGEFCKNTLGATWAVNQDGGGSSTMLVNGVIRNDPSDGTERAVSNGLMMINIEPKVQSNAFSPDNVVKINTANTNVRLGPGTNYASIASLAGNTEGTILDHSLRGVYAKGSYWWKCNFNGTVGWVAENLLTLVSGDAPPSITQHPSPKTVALGGTAIFTVQATGAAPLSYRWRKGGVDLDDGGHYAGVMTSTLTISNADTGDEADYRCVVTNSVGSTPSNAAHLTVVSPDFDGDLDVDLSDWSFLQNCLGIVGVAATNPNCVEADLSGNDIVDRADVLIFTGCMSGPEIPADPLCAQ